MTLEDYNTNNLQKIRLAKGLSLATLQAATGYTHSFLRALEAGRCTQGLHVSSIRKMAEKLEVTPQEIFPLIFFSPEEPAPGALDTIQELVREQTTAEARPELSNLRTRTLVLDEVIEPEESDEEWKVPCIEYVAKRDLFADMIQRARSLGGNLRKDRLLVKSGTRTKPTIFAFPSKEAAETFRNSFHEISYERDPPTPRLEIIHRGAPTAPLLTKHLPPREVESEEEIPSDEIEFGGGEEEEGDKEVTFTVRLTPHLRRYLREVKRLLGPGAKQMIVVQGLLHFAEKLDV